MMLHAQGLSGIEVVMPRDVPHVDVSLTWHLSRVSWPVGTGIATVSISAPHGSAPLHRHWRTPCRFANGSVQDGVLLRVTRAQVQSVFPTKSGYALLTIGVNGRVLATAPVLLSAPD